MDSNEINGSCHCGNIRYIAKIDKTLRNSVTERCNCSICFKTRLWYIRVSENNIEITNGKNQMDTYQFGKKENTYYFCSNCHVEIYGLCKPCDSNTKSFSFVSVPTINGLSPEDFSQLKVIFLDGLNDKMDSIPHTTHYL